MWIVLYRLKGTFHINYMTKSKEYFNNTNEKRVLMELLFHCFFMKIFNELLLCISHCVLTTCLLKVCWNYLLLLLAHLTNLCEFSCQQFLPITPFSQVLFSTAYKALYKWSNLRSFPHGSHYPLTILSTFLQPPYTPAPMLQFFFLAHPGPFRLWSLRITSTILHSHFNYPQ